MSHETVLSLDGSLATSARVVGFVDLSIPIPINRSYSLPIRLYGICLPIE